METIKFIKVFSILVIIILITGCKDILNAPVKSQLSKSTLQTEDGMNGVLNSAYSNAQLQGFWPEESYAYLSMLSSGLVWARKGSVNRKYQPILHFTWQSNNDFFGYIWDELYSAIRDANIVIANIDSDNFSSDFKKEVTAEAKFIRGWSYVELYYHFGPTPLHKAPDDNAILPRASEDEMKAFIEKNLVDAANNLPVNQPDFGRATKGAALGVLCKYYLNTKQWKKSADAAKQIMDMNKYELLPNYTDVFSLENEGNKELLWVLPRTTTTGNSYNAFTFPQDYPAPSNNRVFAAETYLFDSFVNSFDNADTRKNMIITEFTATSGTHVQGLGNDMSLSLKYEWDPNASGASAGNDIPVIRYSDILLSRAEALNELNGPTQESIDLINKVRTRAGISELDLGDFDKSSLRDPIFTERKKEFYYEFKGREDEIRRGTFISNAKARGLNAEDYQKLFPIPQSEADANPKLKQNPGY